MNVAGAVLVGTVAGVVAGALIGVVFATLAVRFRARRATPRPLLTTQPSQPAPVTPPRAATPQIATPLLESSRAEPPAATPSPDTSRPTPPKVSTADQACPEGSVDGLARLSLDALRVGVMVLAPDDEVVYANPGAGHLGLIKQDGGRRDVAHSVLRSLAARTRRLGVTRDVELELPQGLRRDPLGVRVRLVALGERHVAVEVEDMADAHRLARVRRDFVANVSHELKTPVGALQLLAEALVEATDDIDHDEVAAVRRFAERIQHESARMSRLVVELLELSRLEGGEPLPDPEPVALDRIVQEVLDRGRTTAGAKQITLLLDGQRGLKTHGNERLLMTAVANLVDNAVAYSPEQTTVTVSTRLDERHVEIAITDQGIGIAGDDQGRIFERFYRADPARSRATGGTGLGLAIVKHIATKHGGHVSVRSAVGDGSTFTLRLPANPLGTDPASRLDQTSPQTEGPTGSHGIGSHHRPVTGRYEASRDPRAGS